MARNSADDATRALRDENRRLRARLERIESRDAVADVPYRCADRRPSGGPVERVADAAIVLTRGVAIAAIRDVTMGVAVAGDVTRALLGRSRIDRSSG